MSVRTHVCFNVLWNEDLDRVGSQTPWQYLTSNNRNWSWMIGVSTSASVWPPSKNSLSENSAARTFWRRGSARRFRCGRFGANMLAWRFRRVLSGNKELSCFENRNDLDWKRGMSPLETLQARNTREMIKIKKSRASRQFEEFLETTTRCNQWWRKSNNLCYIVPVL